MEFERSPDECSAGARPQMTLVSADTTSAMISTGVLRRISDSSGVVPGGTAAGVIGRATEASAVPGAPAGGARIRLSVRSWVTGRRLAQPGGGQMVISRRRALARD